MPVAWQCNSGNCQLLLISGGISTPSSGHWYFTLKDHQAQILGVMFKGQNRKLKFAPEDGLEVLCHGFVSVYEPRGTYQLIIDSMEPLGQGALQLAFQQLKERLEKDGLLWKMNPALRPELYRKKMLQMLYEGKIDWLETDHAPNTLE